MIWDHLMAGVMRVNIQYVSFFCLDYISSKTLGRPTPSARVSALTPRYKTIN